MAFVNKGKQGLEIALSRKESAESDLKEGKRYTLVKAEEGTWLLVDAEKAKKAKKQVAEKVTEEKAAVTETKPSPVKVTQKEKPNAIEQKIAEMLKQKSLKERVEGKFEELLSDEEKKAFGKMLEDGKVEAFKLNETYKKAVYRIVGAKKKESEKAGAKQKPIEEYSLEKDGLLVIKNEHRAQKIAEKLKEKIQKGEIKGIKTFEGYFYLIDNALYEKYREQVLKAIASGESTVLNNVCEKVGVSKLLCRIVCEFLKEEGEIIEKKKESYGYISE